MVLMARGFSIVAAVFALLLAAPVVAHKGEDHSAAGQPAAETAGDAAGPEPVAVQDGAGDSENAEPGAAARTFDWIARLHPAIVHFPVALLPLAFASALLARRRARWRWTARVLAGLSVVTLPLAALTGWMLVGAPDPAASALLSWHRWNGVALALLALPLGLALARDREGGTGTAVLLLGLGTVLVLGQGWMGGALVHGIDHLAW